MIVAGFDLEYVGKKRPGKHPEFIATDFETGTKFAVEAKSCHWNGILGFVQQKNEAPPLAIAARRQLRNAVEKDADLPLLAFVELNLPNTLPTEGDAIYTDLENAKNLDQAAMRDARCKVVVAYLNWRRNPSRGNISFRKFSRRMITVASAIIWRIYD